MIAVPALVALATGYSAAWWVFVGMLPVFGIYVAVVFYARRVRAEREINVAFLGSAPGPGAGLEDMFAGRDPAGRGQRVAGPHSPGRPMASSGVKPAARLTTALSPWQMQA